MSKSDWSKMPVWKRKVAVAKDVINQIQLKKFKVQKNHYLLLDDDIDVDPSEDPQKAMKCALDSKKCTVCARGAMMLTKVAKYNNFEFDEFYNLNCDHATTDALGDCFTEHELQLIETFFERLSFIDEGDAFNLYGVDYRKWGPNNPEDRLICIMQNIIDHKGQFVPSVEYTI